MRHELDGLIDRKELDEILRWAREEDRFEEQLNRESGEELLKTRGRRPKSTPGMDRVCYVTVQYVMKKAECSLTCACELLADHLGRSAKGISRAYKRAYRWEVALSNFSKSLKNGE